MSERELSLFYRLDTVDRIMDVGGSWDRMARENGGDSLCGASVIGRPLYNFVSGDVSKMFVRTIIDGVRVLQRPRTVAYRCDSPGLRRYMEMSVSCEPGGGLLLKHRQLRTEPIGRRIEFAVGKQALRQLSIRCSHCNAVKVNGHWGQPECLLPADASMPVPVVYGVCPSCLELVRRK